MYTLYLKANITPSFFLFLFFRLPLEVKLRLTPSVKLVFTIYVKDNLENKIEIGLVTFVFVL